MKIISDSFVKMDFKIRLKDGTIAEDSTLYGKQFEFQLGQEIFSDKFESEMIGLQSGSHKKIMLTAKDGFGEKHPAMIYQMPTSRFPEDMEVELGSIISFSQPNGTEMPGVITDVETNEVTVDFNHPLSGQVILIEIDVKDVSDTRWHV
jgi:FKBP-type peptidyl-prolyl cis-trans isomerase SlpA